MTVCRVERRRAVPASHPLATRTGVDALALILAADGHWRTLTARQKVILSEAYRQALVGRVEGDELALPALPAGTHPATVRALERRGLASGGALTALAVQVVAHAGPLDEHRRQNRRTG